MEYRIFGLGPEQDIDLPEARWQFHVTGRDEAWGVDDDRRYPPVRITVDRQDGYRMKVVWPNMEDVPEEIRWKARL